MYFKVHSNANRSVLAASDEEIIGKKISGKGIEFEASEFFYKGKKTSEKDLGKLLEEHDNINLVGEKTVSVALKKGLISEKSVMRINGIPHVQIYKLV